MSKKTFFITGANSGFGLAIATAASKQGPERGHDLDARN